MAEYYAVLKKAVGGLGTNTTEARRAVYDKARNALIGQLKAIDPPLPTSEISRQRLELEEAIRKVERESGQATPSSAAARPTALARPIAPSPPAANAPPPAPAEPAAVEAEGPSPQDVFRRAIQEAEARGSGAPAQPSERTPIPVRAESATGAPPPPEPRVTRARLEPPPPPSPAAPEPDREPEPPSYARAGNEPEARLAPDYDYEWEPAPSAPPPAAPSPFVDRRDRPPPPKSGRRKKGYLEDDDRELAEREARPSRLPSILLFVLILAVLGGLGALAWSQRVVLTDILSSFQAADKSAKSAKPPADAAAEPPASTKNADRLLEGTPAADATDKTVRVVDAPKPADEATAPVAAAPQAPSAGADQTPAPDAIATATPPAAAPPATDQATGDALVAQKAILYEEPLDAAGAASGVIAINAAVTWQYVEKGSDGPEIQARLDVPDRKIKIRLAIRKNSDKTLPASHLVEVVIDVPADFPGKGIRAVPRVVMKPTEEARGQPLIGASAKVADGFFWVALSATDTDVASNLALMKERNWIDLPFVYETGQRAILTFEKGTPGDRVFQKALAAWAGG